MQSKDKKKRKTPLYSTYALSEKHSTNPVTGTSVPSEESVIEAKNWVDEKRE